MRHFIYICLLIIIIFSFSYWNSYQSIESFTPKIREFYRPILRKTRMIGEGFYNKTSSNISNLFRKFGII
jgi:hypothetical protein